MAVLVREGRGRATSYVTSDVIECRCKDQDLSFEINQDEKLGEGGNAIVYKCVERLRRDEWAIKIQVETGRKRIKRFAREVRLLEHSQHDQLMRSKAAGDLEVELKGGNRVACPFVVMPIAELNLMQLRSRTAIPQDELIGQFRVLSAALSELHQSAIHRDIKPENILIRGTAWILSDFGLCKFIESGDDDVDLTMGEEKVGPIYWMSPESMNRTLGRGDQITKASDVFQLAAVFWFAATGRHPTGIVSRDDWHGPDSLYEILSLALSHSPSMRPKDGTAFHQMIEDAILHP